MIVEDANVFHSQCNECMIPLACVTPTRAATEPR